jgi:hypothetical protein
MNPDVEAVVQELDSHREKFDSFCRSLGADELDRAVPGSTWVVRDFIAHLATIDRPVGEMFESMHAGRDPGVRTGDGDRWNVDRWNDGQVQARRGRSIEELLSEAAETRAALRRHLVALSAEDLTRMMKFAGDARRPAAEFPLGAYLHGWCKHDPMHAVDMIRALPGRLTPELEAWFDDPVVQGYQKAMNRTPE